MILFTEKVNYQDTVAGQAGSCSILWRQGYFLCYRQASVQAVWLDMGADDYIEDAVSFQQCNGFLQVVVLQSMVSFKTSGGV